MVVQAVGIWAGLAWCRAGSAQVGLTLSKIQESHGVTGTVVNAPTRQTGTAAFDVSLLPPMLK